MNIPNKHTAAGYIRVSTDDQADNGISLEYQEKACREAAKKDGYTDIEIIKDEGKSGTTLNRAGIQKLIQMAKDKAIDTVFVTNSDRLSRNVVNHGILKQELQKNSVSIKYLNGQSSENTAMANMVDNVLASINQYQSDNTKEKTIQAVDNKAKEGYLPTHAPVGYINVKNTDKNCSKVAQKIIIKDPARAHLIAEAFKLYSTGSYNVPHLNDIMFEKGLTSWTGKKMHVSIFYRMLSNRIYIGDIKWRSIETKGKHEPIIDVATFNKVQEVLKSNTKGCRRRKYTWLLTGFAHCPDHNLRYTAEWHFNKRRAYYHCTNKSGCGKYVEKETLEKMVAEKLKDVELSSDLIEQIIQYIQNHYSQQDKNKASALRKLTTYKSALEIKLKSAEDKFVDENITKDSFERIRHDINKHINATNSQINALSSTKEINITKLEEILSLTSNIYDIYTKAPEEIQKRLIGYFFDKFYVKNGVIVEFVPSKILESLLSIKKAVISNNKNMEEPCFDHVQSIFDLENLNYHIAE